MSSPLQIEANRRNSQLSTGPRTPEGKSISRFNALKSGVHAEAQVIPGEDPAELAALADAYRAQFQPSTPLDYYLVDTLIHADWQLRRLRRIEAQLWTSQLSEIKEDAALGHAYVNALDAFTRLQRRIDSTERSYYRALKQLLEGAPSISSPASPLSPELASFRTTAFDTQPPSAIASAETAEKCNALPRDGSPPSS